MKILKKVLAFREFTLFLMIVIVSFLLSIFTRNFASFGNIRTTAIGMSSDGIIAIGMTMALVSGGFDLSVGSVFALSSIITANLFVSGLNIWVAALIGLISGGVIGLVNGIFIGKVKVNPFVTTLAAMSIARGASYVITQGTPIPLINVSNSFLTLGSGEILGIPVIVLTFIILAVTLDYLMRNSQIFRKVFYVGSNEKAAMLSGINVDAVKIGVFTATGLMAAFAGVLTLARFGVASPTTGVGAELRVISAAVIGGTSLNGGIGSVSGTVLGVILLNIINNGLVLLNVSVHWQQLISGTILLIAVTIDVVSQRRKKV